MHAAAVCYKISRVRRAWVLTHAAGSGADCGLGATVLCVASNTPAGQPRLLDTVGSGQSPRRAKGRSQKPLDAWAPKLIPPHSGQILWYGGQSRFEGTGKQALPPAGTQQDQMAEGRTYWDGKNLWP